MSPEVARGQRVARLSRPRADRQLVLVRHPGAVQTRRRELVARVGHRPEPRVLSGSDVLNNSS